MSSSLEELNHKFQTGMILASILSFSSLAGSSYIVQHVLRSPRRRNAVYTRIMLGMSCMDFLSALRVLTGAFQLPPEATGLPYALGNWPCCIGFGFLGLGGALSSALYNGSLAFYYLLTIRYGWTEYKCKKVEVWFHAVPLALGWGVAIACLPLKLYNPLKMACWLAAYPLGCEASGTCTRGNHAGIYSIAFLYAWVWAVFLWLIVAMAMIYHSISKTERASKTFSFASVEERFSQHPISSSGLPPASLSSNPSTLGRTGILSIVQQQFNPNPDPAASHTSSANQTRRTPGQKKISRTRAFAVQALLYCLAYFLTWIFTLVNMMLVWNNGSLNLTLGFLSHCFIALQGFLNAFIYIRPRYLAYRCKQQRASNDQPVVSQLESYDPRPRIRAFVRALSFSLDDEEILGESLEEGNGTDQPGPVSGKEDEPSLPESNESMPIDEEPPSDPSMSI